MEDLSLFVLDIAQNSIAAGARQIEISLRQTGRGGELCFEIRDDGRGMAPEFAKKAASPFATTRTTRRVGLGLPLLRMTAEQTGGRFLLQSEQGRGTVVRAWFETGHLDCPPLGDMGQTMCALIGQNPQIRFVYRRALGAQGFALDCDEMRAQLGDVPLDDPDVLAFVARYVEENERELWRCTDK